MNIHVHLLVVNQWLSFHLCTADMEEEDADEDIPIELSVRYNFFN